MNLLEQQRLEIEALRFKLKEQEEKIALQEKERKTCFIGKIESMVHRTT